MSRAAAHFVVISGTVALCWGLALLAAVMLL